MLADFRRCTGCLPQVEILLPGGGATWIPWFLDRLSNTYDSDKVAQKMSRHPTEYFEENFFFTVDPTERALGYLCDKVSSKNLTFGSDYPHTDVAGRFSADSELLNTVQLLLLRDDLGDEAKEDIAYKNALKFLGGRIS